MSRPPRRHRVVHWILTALAGALVVFYTTSALVAAHVVALHADDDPETAYVIVDGIRTHYREAGAEGSPVLVLIHGFLGSSFDYLELMALLEPDFHIYAIDLVGFGRSDKPRDFDYGKANQAEHLDAVVDALGVDTFVLGGHSMGGEVALLYALAHPARLSALLLFDAAGLADGAPGPLPTFLYDLIVKNYFLQRAAFAGAYADPAIGDTARFDRMFSYNVTIPAAVLRQFSVDDDSGEAADRLDDIAVPTLVVWGTADGFIPVADATTFAEGIPLATLALVDGAGHLPFQEDPEAVAQAVRDFLLP